VFKSVHDLTPAEVRQYISLYNKTFGRDLNEEEFHYKFTRQMGFNTYFVLMVDDAAGIVGSLGAIEVPYLFRGRTYKFGLTVDAMIAPDYRVDMLAMKRQHEILFAELAPRGFSCVFTKPNNNSYLYLRKLLGFSEIGELSAYGIPLRPFRAASRMLRWLDYLYLPFLIAAGWLARPGGGFQPIPIEAVQPGAAPDESCVHRTKDAAFLRNRYGRNGYYCAGLGGRSVVYGIGEYGVSTCFALEVAAMRSRDWLAFARYVAVRHPEVDVIMRITGKEACPLPLIRIPHRLLPNKFKVVAKPISESALPANAEFHLDLSDFEVV